MPLLDMYNTVTFNDVFPTVDDFTLFYVDNGIPTTIHYGEIVGSPGVMQPFNLQTLYYLLLARYGNNPIANNSIPQFMYKCMSIIFQYGPTWEKRLQIQDRLRGLSESELIAGAKTIYNHAFNPSASPSTATLEELSYINEQNTTSYKKNKLEAYTILWDLLKVDVTEQFLQQFKKLFKIVVVPDVSHIFETDLEDDNIGEEEIE